MELGLPVPGSQSPQVGAMIRTWLRLLRGGRRFLSQSPQVGAMIRTILGFDPSSYKNLSQSPQVGAMIRTVELRNRTTGLDLVSIPSSRGNDSDGTAKWNDVPNAGVSIPSSRGNDSDAIGNECHQCSELGLNPLKSGQ